MMVVGLGLPQRARRRGGDRRPGRHPFVLPEAFEVTHTAQSLVAKGDLVRVRFVIHGRRTGD